MKSTFLSTDPCPWSSEWVPPARFSERIPPLPYPPPVRGNHPDGVPSDQGRKVRPRAIERLLSDPERAACYRALAVRRRQPLLTVARVDFRRPPRIRSVDLDHYDGQPGDDITMCVTDTVAVAGVKVSVSDGTGLCHERGECGQLPNGLWCTARGPRCRASAVSSCTCSPMISLATRRPA